MEQNISLLKVFWDNFIGFDFLIFILAIINAYVFWRLLYQTKAITEVLYPTTQLTSGKESYEALGEHYKHQLDVKGEESLIQNRRKMTFLASLSENITQIFPLMGLLGTVISLIPMVESLGNIDTSLFFSALTSTFWGIVFAIIYKGLSGVSGGAVEEVEKSISLFLERRSALLIELTRKDS